ncbi:hypothetical protein COCOBI_02-8320 [Coccomyxa sp. Obi]|nr:hypothetical protein COCOBI_02-8320 [Coccomyxa sp. Obi]
MVNQRFNRLLSWPDPSLRPYGSVSIVVDDDDDQEGSLPPSLIEKYIVKRAAGFKRVCFQSGCAVGEGQPSRILMHKFFAASLPQIAALFAKYHVELDIEVFQGGHLLFPDPGHPVHPDDDDNNEGEDFSAEYWQVLSPVLTKLYLMIGADEIDIDSQAWLNSMQKLQHLEMHGFENEDRFQPVLFGTSNLSLSALKLLRLENFSSVPDWHLDCPSLEALHLTNIQGLCVPTGLGSCSRLTTLDVAAPLDPVHVDVYGGLPAAIKSVQQTLEVLDISGWSPALNGILALLSSLPRLHTLVAQRMGLAAVPALPATLKSLDLRANEFTEVPVQLESLTQLTSLALSSKESFAHFQIRRPLDRLIGLPHLRKLTLVLDSEVHNPAYTRWGARSLYYLGLAQHEIARSRSSLLLKF